MQFSRSNIGMATSIIGAGGVLIGTMHGCGVHIFPENWMLGIFSAKEAAVLLGLSLCFAGLVIRGEEKELKHLKAACLFSLTTFVVVRCVLPQIINPCGIEFKAVAGFGVGVLLGLVSISKLWIKDESSQSRDIDKLMLYPMIMGLGCSSIVTLTPLFGEIISGNIVTESCISIAVSALALCMLTKGAQALLKLGEQIA